MMAIRYIKQLSIFAVIEVLLGGCATQKEVHGHHFHTTTVDSLATEAKADGNKHQQAENLDSIVTASIWAALQEFSSQEHSTETTTETITSWVDSLGREMRQEQRTTQREISKQEQQRQQQQLQQLQTAFSRQLAEMDSSWSQRLSKMETHLRDSLNQTIDKRSQTAAASPVSWWQLTWSWLKGSLIGLAIGAFIVFILKNRIISFIKKHYV